MLDRDAVLHPDPPHQAFKPIGAKNPQQVIFKREIKTRRAGVALASRAAAQLIIDAARFVPLSAEDMQAACLEHLFTFGNALLAVSSQRLLEICIIRILGAGLGSGKPFGIATKHDIGATPGHVGRDRYRLEAACLSDDFGFALMVLGIEHGMLDAGFFELVGNSLGFFDRNRADQHGLSALMAVFYLFYYRVEFLALGLE